ncbi:polysaccharide deacetylase [Paraburkholderia sp. Ac-20336]|uniref:polysaccharide deacetylase family protein n=1 Tax=Paraburkholderia sp. Ac-20336 TaxID=2703886 RepID=UPI001F11C998|nr:polysaccharide deacetylase [Paraburkholderia sp. Ac-20336]
MNSTSNQEPWQWPDTQWQMLVDRVRAGRPLKPGTWKNGARCAFAVSFDSDHETSDLRDGGRSISRLSAGQYSSRAGIPRIADILRRHDVPATFFVPAVSALLHPDEQRALCGAGHEIAMHGWIHELNSMLPAAAERELYLRASDTLTAICGERPVGLRTPSWDFSDHTLAIIAEMGLLYDSSLMGDDDCYELVGGGQPTGIVEIPVEWIRDDSPYLAMNRFSSLRPYTPPAAVLDIFIREFEAAYAEGGLFQLTLHPHVIGHRSRIWILEEIVRLAKSRPDVWFTTHRDLAQWVSEHAD